MQTRRLLNSIFLLVILSLLLSACGAKEPVPVTITYYRRGYVEGGTDEASQRIRLVMEAFQKRYPYITVSGGIAERRNASNEGLEDVLLKADKALYNAKGKGRDLVIAFQLLIADKETI